MEFDDIITLINQRIKASAPLPDEEKARFGSLVVRRFREGLIDLPGLLGELHSLHYTAEDIDLYVTAATMEYDTDYRSDLLSAFREAFRKDLLTEAEYTRQLTELGVVPQRIQGYLFQDNVRKTGKKSP